MWLIRSPALVFPAPKERPGAPPDHDDGWDVDETSSTDELWDDWDQWETDDDWRPDSRPTREGTPDRFSRVPPCRLT